eukprot:TRINITY_DN32395_c0_g1_i1.p2 TRINITY_DN32395_c0_g1~~TRINITY_DN32395_c0_g1_i1.p2  ORF type:complete len:285 (+),score=86.13 TRINITY_DN32395_c0_g1_i1:49-903(+)
MPSAVTRIIRFVGEDGAVYLGEEPARPGLPATVLDGDLLGGQLRRTGRTRMVSRLLAPIVPTDIYCIGLNYRRHFEESARVVPGMKMPELPPVFMKPKSTLAHPGQDIWMPDIDGGHTFDWEVELVIVIGRACRNVSKEEALSHVLGYTVANDVSCRHWQNNAGAGQWIKGKGFDTFCPLGPVLVTADEIGDPQTLQLSTRVNGQVQQNSNTADMIFSCAEIVSWLSNNTTLLPGTVILTGTPEGVAAARQPPNFLRPGDVVECEISRIGVLRNTAAAAPKARV